MSSTLSSALGGQPARPAPKGLAVFFWVIAIVGAAFGGFQLFSSLATANGAPQQAAGAAMGCAMAIIPYVIARAVDELTR